MSDFKKPLSTNRPYGFPNLWWCTQPGGRLRPDVVKKCEQLARKWLIKKKLVNTRVYCGQIKHAFEKGIFEYVSRDEASLGLWLAGFTAHWEPINRRGCEGGDNCFNFTQKSWRKLCAHLDSLKAASAPKIGARPGT